MEKQRREMGEFLAYVEILYQRRMELNKSVPPCPKCSEALQLQLLSTLKPAWWKCRMCSHRFYFEPSPAPEPVEISNEEPVASGDQQIP